ncbi:MAG TPA: OmpH family outer membrane protein [Terriglobales bacterium]
MNSKFAPFTLAVVVLSVMALGQSSSAAPKPAADTPSAPASAASFGKIGIINMQQAILASNEGQRDFQALSKKFEPKQAELKGMNDEVDNLKKQLNTQGDKLNDMARANLVKSIESKQKELQRNLEDAQSDFQGQQNDILQQVGQKMMQTLDKYAKANGYSLILDVSNQNSPVLWAGASTDVTKAIVDEYNTTSGVPAPPPTAGAKGGLPAAPRPATSKAPAKPQR